MTDYLNNLLQILDKVQGMSAAALVCVSCIVVGYVLRFIKKFPNDGIPVVVILWGAVAMLFIADPHPPATTMRVWTVRNFLVGLTIGLIAWMLHKFVLSWVEDYLAKKFPSASNTAFFNKPDPTDKPVAPEPPKP